MYHTYYAIDTLDKNRKEPRSRYMTWKQKLEVVNDTNEIALMLLEFYYSKASMKYDFDDEQVAKALNWTTKKVSDNRRKLEKVGYFNKEITRNSKSSTLNILIGHERWGNNK